MIILHLNLTKFNKYDDRTNVSRIEGLQQSFYELEDQNVNPI